MKASSFPIGVGIGVFVLSVGLAACNSGGGIVSPCNPLNPGDCQVATQTPTQAPTQTPTQSPTGSATTAPPTIAPSIAPSTAPSGSTSCTTSSAAPSSMTYTLSGQAQTITLPPYNVWSGSSDIPVNDSSNQTHLTVKTSQNNFDGVASSNSGDAAYGSRTKDFYSTTVLDRSTMFGTGGTGSQPLIPIHIDSPCLTPGTTYFIDIFALGTFQYSESAAATAGTNGGHVDLHLKVTVNPFPANSTADIVISH